jgi:hypothetical protein
MCSPGLRPTPVTAAEAVAMTRSGLAWLAGTDAGALTAAEQADCLRELERAESLHTAARASVLAAFAAAGGFENDGHGSARTWLKWQARITGGAAAGAIGWMRRLAAHPAVRDALAAGIISASWAREFCDWTDLLPESARAEADLILLAAAAGGAELADLAGLADEMRKCTAPPDTDTEDGFDDRWLRLDTTFRGTGRIDGGLTPQCSAAVAAVLEALGKKAGPEDTRSKRQRDHDALEEAMRRLIAAGGIPDRAGQPTQIQLHMTLDQLRSLDSDHTIENGWASQNLGPDNPRPDRPGPDDPRLSGFLRRRGEGGDGPAGPHGRFYGAAGPHGWLTGPAAGPGANCDATIVPIVSGNIDRALLDQMTAELVGRQRLGNCGDGSKPPPGQDGGDIADATRRERARRAVRWIVIRDAADLLSGPAGLASYLRTGLVFNGAGSPSLLLDVGSATDTIPAHLRRAVIARDRHCRFPGCDQPAAACQPHHLIPRANGGPHSLSNLLLLCSFHHLIAVHRWGWTITLHPDATVTATSPDRTRVLHSHSPPATAA